KDTLIFWFGDLEVLAHVRQELLAINQGLFRVYEGIFPLSSLVLAFYGLLAVAYFASRPSREHDPLMAEKAALGLLAAAILMLYLLLPQWLGAHGGYLTARLPFLPPLLLLPFLGLPQQGVLRRVSAIALAVALAANVALMIRYVARAQAEIT